MKTKIDALRNELSRICIDSAVDLGPGDIFAEGKIVIQDDFELERVDSLGRAELIVAVETDFNVQLSNQEILTMKTFGDLVVILKSRVPEQVGES